MAKVINPGEAKVGVRVWYYPMPGVRFVGTVREAPWRLGDGTWVTHLHEMEPAYSVWRGTLGRTWVPAAALHCLEPWSDE